MTALWQFYAIPEPPLLDFVQSLKAAIHRADARYWQDVHAAFAKDAAPPPLTYQRPGRTGGRNATNTAWYAGVPDLVSDQIPEWRSPSLDALLRETTLRTAAETHVSRDSKPGVRFTLIGGEDWCDEEDLEYERLLAHVFRAGTDIAEPLAYLGGGTSASVAWVRPNALGQLLAAEAGAGLLERLSRELKERQDPLGYDLGDLLALMQTAYDRGLSLYYWEPGT